MIKIGKEYINVESMEKHLVVYVREKTHSSPGSIMLTNENGRSWVNREELDNDFVEV